MLSTLAHKSKDNTIINGYLRDATCTTHDYHFIFLIIAAYHKQVYAKSYNPTIDKDYKQKIKFGDIVRKDNEYYVVTQNQKLEFVGRYDIRSWRDSVEIRIPFSICKHLSDAVLFYSKLSNDSSFKNKKRNDFLLSLDIKYNDKGLIKELGGQINAEYVKSIIIEYYNKSLDCITVRFVSNNERNFSPRHYMVTYRDIDEFYEIRKDHKTNMVKLRVSSINIKKVWRVTYSALWNYHRCREYIDYIGPKIEMHKAIFHLWSLYGDEFNFKIINFSD